jgi:hypothetical protein
MAPVPIIPYFIFYTCFIRSPPPLPFIFSGEWRGKSGAKLRIIIGSAKEKTGKMFLPVLPMQVLATDGHGY